MIDFDEVALKLVTNDIQNYYRNTPEPTNHGRSQKKIDRTKKQ